MVSRKLKIRGDLFENLAPQMQQILSIKSFDKTPTLNDEKRPPPKQEAR